MRYYLSYLFFSVLLAISVALGVNHGYSPTDAACTTVVAAIWLGHAIDFIRHPW